MEYSAVHNKLLITPKELERFAGSIRYSMASIRKALNVPLGLRDQAGALQPIDHIEKGLLDACKDIGIDMGAVWGEELDLSKYKG